jgi:hypothetical protein
MANQPNNQPILPQHMPQRRSFTSAIAGLVVRGVVGLFWLVVAALALGLAFIAVSGIIFGVRLCTHALGL